MASSLYERYPTEFGAASLFNSINTVAITGRPLIDTDSYAAASFFAMLARIHQRLSKRGRAALEGKVRSGLQEPSGLAPLAFEFSIVSHLLHAGLDVQFNDYENDGGFDFLVAQDAVELELECKFISHDAGRREKLADVEHLLAELDRQLPLVLDRSCGLCAIELAFSKGIPKSNRSLRVLMENVIAHIGSGPQTRAVGDVAVSYSYFPPLEEIRDEPSQSYLKEKVAERVGMEFDGYAGSAIRADGQGIVAYVRPAASRGLLAKIKHEILAADRDQLSRTRPGVIAVQFGGITGNELAQLSSSVGQANDPLAILAAEVFRRRPHLLCLWFLARDEPKRFVLPMERVVETYTMGSGTLLYYGNAQHPLRRQIEALLH
jgi:hypothetical protein